MARSCSGFTAWSNFDTTIDRLITEQPKEWLPKEFSSYAELLRATYDDARTALTKSLGEDESKWKWGEMVKVRFQHPLAAAPLIGLQFTIPPFPQNGSGGLAATVNVGAAVSMRLIADAGDWDQDTTWDNSRPVGYSTNPHWKDQLDDWKAVTPQSVSIQRSRGRKSHEGDADARAEELSFAGSGRS